MLMIFEDYDDSRFVSMVRDKYTKYGITVVGAGGNGTVKSTYDRYAKPDEYTLIFIDVIPDNVKL